MNWDDATRARASMEETMIASQQPLGTAEQKLAEEAVPPVWQVGDTILDLYEVKEQFTSGGMGLVYRVHHKGWNVDLAVKSPRPEFFATEGHRENFVREAETWVNLGLHPHIVSCHYVRTLGGIPRVFAEYVEGGSLKDWIDDGRLYQGGREAVLERILDVAIQFAWGLEYAHEQGLVHQDVKPANVMMTPEGDVQVTDFGLARARAVAGESAVMVGGQSILVSSGGMTPAYCSPEQAAGRPLSRKTDIWSWGLSVLEMFTGEVTWPFGQAAAEVLEEYLEHGCEDPSLPVMPAALAELLRRCFQEEPSSRPATMDEIASELQAVYAQERGQPYPRQRPEAAELLADALNNRAVSALDLGRGEQAEALWAQALQADPQHVASIYNWGVIRWRSGRVTDQALVQQLDGARGSDQTGWLVDYLLGLVHLERGDVNAAVSVLEAAAERPDAGLEVADTLAWARSGSVPATREVSLFEGHIDGITSVTFSLDGRFALAGSYDNTLRLWEVASGRCLRTFEKLGFYEVTSVSFSPDGRFALAGSDAKASWDSPKTLGLWEVGSGRLLRIFEEEGFSGDVFAVSFSPDGRFALSGSRDKTLRLWDVGSGRLLRTFEGHTGTVSSVSFSPDGRFALSGGNTSNTYGPDNTVRLWEVGNGHQLRTFEGHTGNVYDLSFSPDGRFALSGSSDRTLRLWEVASGRCMRTFEGHANTVSSVSFSPDGRLALSGSWDLTVRLWDVASGRCLRTFEGEGYHGSVDAVSFSPDGRYTLSGGYKIPLRLRKVPGQFAPVCALYMSRPIRLVDALGIGGRVSHLLSSADAARQQGQTAQALELVREARSLPGYERAPRSLQAWHRLAHASRRTGLQAGWPLRTFEGHTNGVTSVSFSPDGRFALSGSYDRTLRLWNVASGRCLRTSEGHTTGVRAVSFSPDGRFALSGSLDKTQLWDVASGRCLRTFEEHLDVANAVSFSPDGRFALLWGRRTLWLWEVASGRCLPTFEGNTGRGAAASFSPDGRFALSGGYHMPLRLWEVASGRCLRTFEGHTAAVTAVSFSPDGRFVLSGSHWMRLWDVASGRCLRAFEGYTKDRTSVSFSPDGRYALSGSYDKIVRLWEVSSGRCLRTFEGHTGYVHCVSFSPDGRFAISGSHDKTLRLWELDWDLEVPEPADWDDGARPYLETFLTLHTAYAAPLPPEGELSEPQVQVALSRQGRPSWSEEDFQGLIRQLQHAGYGWLRPEGVRRELERMARHWPGSPSL